MENSGGYLNEYWSIFSLENKSKNKNKKTSLCRLGWLGTHRSTCLWLLNAGIKDVCCHARLVGHFYFKSHFQNLSTGPLCSTTQRHCLSSPPLLTPTLPRKARLLLPFSTCNGIRETVTSSLPPTRDALTSGLDIRMKDGIKTRREGRVRGGVSYCRTCAWGACAGFLRGPGFQDPRSSRFPQAGPCRPYHAIHTRVPTQRFQDVLQQEKSPQEAE